MKYIIKYNLFYKMPKLYFRYGTMNSSKTANLLMVSHNYKSQNKNVILIKPSIDTRFGINTINSRVGISEIVDISVDINSNLLELNIEGIDCILVDECQFLYTEHVDQLRILAQYVPVMCYGLRTDYRSKLFPGSQRLMELSDSIEEIKTTCVNCNKKAIINAKFRKDEDKIVILKEGSDLPELGDEDKYQAMCFGCWNY